MAAGRVRAVTPSVRCLARASQDGLHARGVPAGASWIVLGPSTLFVPVVPPVVPLVAPRGEPAVAAVAAVAPPVVYVPAHVLVDPAGVARGLDPIAPEVLPGSFRGAREPSSRAVRPKRPVASILASVARVPAVVVLVEGHGRQRTRAFRRRAALGALALHLFLPREPVQPEQRSARLRGLEDVRRAVAAAAGRRWRFAGHPPAWPAARASACAPDLGRGVGNSFRSAPAKKSAIPRRGALCHFRSGKFRSRTKTLADETVTSGPISKNHEGLVFVSKRATHTRARDGRPQAVRPWPPRPPNASSSSGSRCRSSSGRDLTALCTCALLGSAHISRRQSFWTRVGFS